MVPELTKLVRGFVPEATSHLEVDPGGYFCASWRVHGRDTRELFVEHAGPDVPPCVVRVGVYFADAPAAVRDANAYRKAFQALSEARPALQALNAMLTFTPGSATRDDVRYGWTDGDLRDWLTRSSDNRDLVWHWDLRSGLPSLQQVEAPLAALVPVWHAWNSTGA
jgi:hypothetical protein